MATVKDKQRIIEREAFKKRVRWIYFFFIRRLGEKASISDLKSAIRIARKKKGGDDGNGKG